MFIRRGVFFVVMAVVALAETGSYVWARDVVLNQVLERVARVRSKGGAPVVVMDLDETVVDSIPRRFQAYQQAMVEFCGTVRAGNCGKVAGLNIAEFLALKNRYDQRPLLAQVGIVEPGWSSQLVDRAVGIYLSGRWMELDQAISGATEYVQELRAAGATLFFVSSRWKSRQEAGTLASLKHLGMATDSDAARVLLRRDGQSSIDFKRESFSAILRWAADHGGMVAGAFENEPENMNAMFDAFPEAVHVFVNGAYIKSEELRGDAVRIENYR